MDGQQVRKLLEVQAGVVSRAQMITAGATDNDLRRLVRRRRLARVHPRVYVDHTGPLTWAQRAWAATLSCAPAALADESAIRAAEGPGRRRHDDGRPILVAVGGGERHRRRRLPGRCGGRPDDDRLPARRRARELCPDRTQAVPRSRDRRRHGRDLLDVGARLPRPRGAAAGLADLDAAVARLATIRLGWGQVFDRPCRTAASLGRIMAAHGWTGEVARCPRCPPTYPVAA